MFRFGSGVLWGTALTDSYGNTLANPTPRLFGTLQDVSLDVSGDTKLLYGQQQFAVAAGRGKMKITGKAKFAKVSGSLLNDLFFGQTMAFGVTRDVNDLTGTAIPASSPYTITINPGGSRSYAGDLGVVDANGNPMTRVASAPAPGQYSVNTGTGVYTFAAADTGKTVYISYQYTGASTSEKTLAINNIQMGNAPTFRIDLSEGYGSGYQTCVLYQCMSSKLTPASKQDDFTITELDFDTFADSMNRVALFGFSD